MNGHWELYAVTWSYGWMGLIISLRLLQLLCRALALLKTFKYANMFVYINLILVALELYTIKLSK